MGHSEMLLAVAGLDESSLDDRTRRLAGVDWSSFPPADRVAFRYAHALSKRPSAVAGEVAALVDHFGRDRAIDVIWWASRCHYMTRFADAFQIPLERENVFKPAEPPPAEGDGR